MGEYSRRDFPIKIIIEFRKKWDKCKNLDDKYDVREEFFNLEFGEEALEVGWDKVVLGEEYYPLFPKILRDNNSNLPYNLPKEELIRFRNYGYNVKELSQIFKVDYKTMIYVLKELGINKNTRKVKRDNFIYSTFMGIGEEM